MSAEIRERLPSLCVCACCDVRCPSSCWVCVSQCLGRGEGCQAHKWLLGSLQDKYLADMDELFSQVDEKRKVSCPSSGACG